MGDEDHLVMVAEPLVLCVQVVRTGLGMSALDVGILDRHSQCLGPVRTRSLFEHAGPAWQPNGLNERSRRVAANSSRDKEIGLILQNVDYQPLSRPLKPAQPRNEHLRL